MKKFTNCVLLTVFIFVALLNAINAKNDVLDTNAVNNQGNSVRVDFMDLKRVEVNNFSIFNFYIRFYKAIFFVL